MLKLQISVVNLYSTWTKSKGSSEHVALRTLTIIRIVGNSVRHPLVAGCQSCLPRVTHSVKHCAIFNAQNY